MHEIPGDIDCPGLTVRRLGLNDLEVICRHRERMFL